MRRQYATSITVRLLEASVPQRAVEVRANAVIERQQPGAVSDGVRDGEPVERVSRPREGVDGSATTPSSRARMRICGTFGVSMNPSRQMTRFRLTSKPCFFSSRCARGLPILAAASLMRLGDLHPGQAVLFPASALGPQFTRRRVGRGASRFGRTKGELR